MNSPKTKYTLVKMANGTNKLVLKTKKTLSQDLYNGVFHPKTSSNIRDIIFRFKCEARFEIVDKTLRCFDDNTGRWGQKIDFKLYSSTPSKGIRHIYGEEHPVEHVGGIKYPIKNREELYVIFRDWMRCHYYLKTGPFCKREDGHTLEEFYRLTEKDYGIFCRYTIMNYTLNKLVDIDRFYQGVHWPELWRILLTNDKFDKKLILKTWGEN